jgi:hypothetical protein
MGLLIRNSFLLAKTEDAGYGVLGSAIASTDALKIISMEINPITGPRVDRALAQRSHGRRPSAADQ